MYIEVQSVDSEGFRGKTFHPAIIRQLPGMQPGHHACKADAGLHANHSIDSVISETALCAEPDSSHFKQAGAPAPVTAFSLLGYLQQLVYRNRPLKNLRNSRWPADLYPVNLLVRTEAEVNRVIALR